MTGYAWQKQNRTSKSTVKEKVEKYLQLISQRTHCYIV